MAHASRVGDDHPFAVRLHLPRAREVRMERIEGEEALRRGPRRRLPPWPLGASDPSCSALRARKPTARAPVRRSPGAASPQQGEPEVGPRDGEHGSVAELPVGLDRALEMSESVIEPSHRPRRQSESCARSIRGTRPRVTPSSVAPHTAARGRTRRRPTRALRVALLPRRPRTSSSSQVLDGGMVSSPSLSSLSRSRRASSKWAGPEFAASAATEAG